LIRPATVRVVSREFRRAFVRVCLVPLFAVVSLAWGIDSLGPEWRAAHGEGTLGTYRVTSVCHHKGCRTTGDFTPDGGTGSRSGIGYAWLPTGTQVGDVVRARDVGDPDEVYPPSGSNSWMFTVALMAAGGVAGLWWLWRYPVSWLVLSLRARRRPVPLGTVGSVPATGRPARRKRRPSKR
jgi:hypothetical protein